ncbi:MAG: polysaccharide pyruvyl transferase CsaB [Fimbriimonadaceae bacterium]
MAANLLLAGYFGSGNLGDDAMLLGFAHSLGPGFDISVLSGSPEDTYRLHGYRSIPRRDFKAIGEELKRTDALVFPGGSIFQDVTSTRSVAYYAQLVKLAKRAGKKVFLLSQGVGPLNGFFGKRIAVAAFQAADVVTVRDPGSAATLRDLGFRGNARVTADAAFLLQPDHESDTGSFSVGNMTTVGIAPRPHKDKKATVKLFAELSQMLFKSNMMPVLIEMDQHEDGPLILEISKAQGGKIPDLRKLQRPQQVMQRMARMDAVIAMRLHAGIFAAAVGVPPFMISYDPKVAAFAKLMELSYAGVEGLSAQRLFEQFMNFQKDRERNTKIIARKRDEMANLARQNIDIVRESLAVSVRD